MPLYRALLQTLGATALLALALGCHGKGGGLGSDTAKIQGTVTFMRVPLAKDANGVPTGLMDATVSSNLVSTLARGVQVRVYQQETQTAPDGTVTTVWLQSAHLATTDASGYYATTALKGKPTMVELLSTFDGGSGQIILLTADPAGIASTVPPQDRVQYALRKAVDGTSPAGVPVPSAVLSADAVVNFSVGLTDPWWITSPVASQSTGVANVAADLETDPVKFPGRTVGSGSRVLAIGDTIASFITNYGSATPGNTLLLHYWPGRSEPGGSFVVYDQSLLPLSLSSSTYFGTLQGGPANDDAWDEAVILNILAHNSLYSSTLFAPSGSSPRLFGITRNPIFPPVALQASLSPEVARMEGLAQTMAANVLKSPYLADTAGTSLAAPVVDVRDLGGLTPSQLGPFSARALRAFAWELILKANGQASPGTATSWSTIDPLATARFFLGPTTTNTFVNGLINGVEPVNVFLQLKRLKEGKSPAEPVDLAVVMTDPVIASLGAPFGITWPRPLTGPYALFASDWGVDPTGTLPPVVLSMAKAAQTTLPYPAPALGYPNASLGEVFYTGFSLTADKRCTLSMTITPALTPGGQVDLDFPQIPHTFSFTGSGGSAGIIVIPVNDTPPFYHPVRIRLKSPAALQPDVTVSITFTPAA